MAASPRATTSTASFRSPRMIASRGCSASGRPATPRVRGTFVLPATALRVGMLLCVEAMFPDLVRQAVRPGRRRPGQPLERRLVRRRRAGAPAARHRDAARRREPALPGARRRDRLLGRDRPVRAHPGGERLRYVSGSQRDRARIARPHTVPALGRRLRVDGDRGRGDRVAAALLVPPPHGRKKETRMKSSRTARHARHLPRRGFRRHRSRRRAPARSAGGRLRARLQGRLQQGPGLHRRHRRTPIAPGTCAWCRR